MAGSIKLLCSPSLVNAQGSILKIENGKGPGNRKCTFGVPKDFSFQGNRTYVNVLKVQTSSPFVGALQVQLQITQQIGNYYQWPLPETNGTSSLPGTLPYEQDTGSFVQSIDCDEDSDDGMQWKVTINYGPFDVNHEMGSQNANEAIFSPLDMPPQVRWSEAKYERYKIQDEADPPNPFVNTVGDPLEDPPKTEETRPVLTFIRNEATYSDQYAGNFKDTINSDVFLGYPPGTVKCCSITAERIYAPDWGYYWPVTYQFEFRDDPDGYGYTEQVLNAGFRQLVSGVPTTIAINGAPISSPVALTKAGTYDPTADAYNLQFTMFPSIPFAQLNIPQDLFTQTT